MYLEVEPGEATEASRELYRYAIDNKHTEEVSSNVATCLEKMVNYAVKSHGSLDIHIRIMIRFWKNTAKFIMFGDGERLNLRENDEPDKMLIENLDLVKKWLSHLSTSMCLI